MKFENLSNAVTHFFENSCFIKTDVVLKFPFTSHPVIQEEIDNRKNFQNRTRSKRKFSYLADHRNITTGEADCSARKTFNIEVKFLIDFTTK